MIEEFGRAGFLLVFAIAFPIIPIVASFVFGIFKLRPARPDPIKSDTYECGVETEGDALGQFNVRYYIFALLFVIFDVEAVFLYPYAVSGERLAIVGLIEVLTFVGVLFIGLLYAWRKNALEWT